MPIQSISRNVRQSVVCLLSGTRNRMDWRLLVKEHIAKIAGLQGLLLWLLALVTSDFFFFSLYCLNIF